MKALPTSKSFTKWRNIILADLFLGYCFYYVTRKSCTYSAPLFLQDKSISMSNEVIGIVASSQMLFYSIGKFMCGILSDKYSSKLMFSIGLVCSGLCNILFAMCHHSYQFTILWSVNGFFQGCGWAPIAILVKRWYLPTEIGKIWSLMSASMNISSGLIPILMVSLSSRFDWRSSFILIGISSCIFSLISYQLVKDDPAEVTGETVTNNQPSDTTTTSNKPEVKAGSYMEILSSKFLCVVSLCYLLWTGVKNGIEDWLLVYLIGEKSLTAYQASFSVMYFQCGGLLSSLTCGIISDILIAKLHDKMKSSPRLPVVFFCSTFIIGWIYLLQSHFITGNILINITCFFIGLFCYGPHTLFGLLVLENSPPRLTGTAHGIASTAAQVGSIFAGYPLSYLSDKYGWNMAFSLIAAIAFVNSLLLVIASKLSCKIGEKEE